MPRGGGSGGLRPCRARRRRPGPDGSRRRPKGNQTHVFLAAANKPPPHNLPQTATPPDHLAASDEIKEQRPTRPTCTGKQKRGRFLPSRRAASCWDKRLGYGATFRPEDSNGHKKKCWSSMFHLFVSLLGCSPVGRWYFSWRANTLCGGKPPLDAPQRGPLLCAAATIGVRVFFSAGSGPHTTTSAMNKSSSSECGKISGPPPFPG